MSKPTLTNEYGVELDLGIVEFGVVAITDSASTSRVVIGNPQVDRELVAIGDVSGLFASHHGIRGRQIIWSGEIRATQEKFASILDQRDEWAAYAGVLTFVDDLAREYATCIMQSFDLQEKRSIISPDGLGELWWRVPFQITLLQLEV